MDGDTKYEYDIFTSMPECLRIFIVIIMLMCPPTFKRNKFWWVVGITIYCAQYVKLATCDGNITLTEYEVYGYFGAFG